MEKLSQNQCTHAVPEYLQYAIADHFLMLVYSMSLTSEGKASSMVSPQDELEESDFAPSNVLVSYIVEQQTPKCHTFIIINNCTI